MCSPDLAVLGVQDREGTLAQLGIGNLRSTWSDTLETCSRLSTVKVERRADIAIVCPGRPNLDTTLYDATSCLYSALECTRAGGMIVLVAECPRGVGPDGFLKGVGGYSSSAELSVDAVPRFEFGMERAPLFWKALESRELVLCSRLRESLVSEHFHCIGVRDLQDAVTLASEKFGYDGRVALLPSGSYTVPQTE
jgi:nickel-dependent lactate racemase